MPPRAPRRIGRWLLFAIACHAGAALALVLAAGSPRPAPERVVRVTLLPFVEEAAPGPKAPSPAPSPAPPAPRVERPAPPKPVAPPKQASPPRPVAKPRAVAVATPPPVAPVPAEATPAPPAEPAGPPSASGAPGDGAPGAVASAPPAGAGGRAGRGAGGDEIALYVSRVRAQLERHLEYPPLARRRGLEGTVLIELRIDADGRVASARAAGGDRRVFARSALAAIDRAGRFPAPPGGPLAIEVPMSFELGERR